uniref:Uncharacterized protein n=1 Tax=Populus trichocarpa TaxID=3694 RepID=A0A3N7GCH9_POPTR
MVLGMGHHLVSLRLKSLSALVEEEELDWME